MKLTATVHFWYPKLREMIRNWFDFRIDLTGLSIDEEDLAIDLNTGRE